MTKLEKFNPENLSLDVRLAWEPFGNRSNIRIMAFMLRCKQGVYKFRQIAYMTDLSIGTIHGEMQKLIKHGYIIKRKNKYFPNLAIFIDVQDLEQNTQNVHSYKNVQDIEQNVQDPEKNVQDAEQMTSIYNNIKNSIKEIDTHSTDKDSKLKLKHPKYSNLRFYKEELEKLEKFYGDLYLLELGFEILDDYLEDKDQKKYKSHYLVMRKWVYERAMERYTQEAKFVEVKNNIKKKNEQY